MSIPVSFNATHGGTLIGSRKAAASLTFYAHNRRNPKTYFLQLILCIMTDLKVGEKVPDFTLPKAVGKKVSLGELVQQGTVVIGKSISFL